MPGQKLNTHLLNINMCCHMLLPHHLITRIPTTHRPGLIFNRFGQQINKSTIFNEGHLRQSPNSKILQDLSLFPVSPAQRMMVLRMKMKMMFLQIAHNTVELSLANGSFSIIRPSCAVLDRVLQRRSTHFLMKGWCQGCEILCWARMLRESATLLATRGRGTG